MQFDSSRRRNGRPFGGRTTTTTRPESRRLLTLVLMLGLVMVLMSSARDPNSWTWFTGPQPPPQADDNGDRIDTRVAPKPAASEPVVLADVSIEDTAAQRNHAARQPYFRGVNPDYFTPIRDNTPYRSAEEDAWCQLIQILGNNEQHDLEAASRGHATFRQLYQQPTFYRGQLVTLSGVARRAEKMRIPKNGYRIEGDLYRIWLWPRGSANPVVIESLQIPENFPIGESIEQNIEVTGFFFKIWVYKASDGLRLAPMLLAKLPRRDESRVPRGRLVVEPRPPADDRDLDKPSQPTAREWLKHNRDLDDTFFAQFKDGNPFAAPTQSTDDEPAALVRLLYHVPALAHTDLQFWSAAAPSWDDLRKSPANYRGQALHIDGKLTRVDRVDLPAPLAQKFEMSHVYRAEIRRADETPVVVYLRSIAKPWQPGAALDEQVYAPAVFVKSVSTTDGQPQLVFATERLAWKQNTLLGDLGVDGSLRDHIANQQEIRRDERSLFFQMLAAAGRMPADELNREAHQRQLDQQAKQPLRPKYADGPSNSYVVRDVITEPLKHFGDLATLSGQAMRATRVAVEDAGERHLYGFDHYYMIDVVVTLDPPLHTNTETGDQLNRNTYPAVFAVRKLPEGFAEGDDINESVRVAGFFLKLWRPPLAAGETATLARQRGTPMFIGHDLTWYPREVPVTSPWPTIIACTLIVAVALVLVIAYFFLRRIDRRREQQARDIRAEPEPEAFQDLAAAVAQSQSPDPQPQSPDLPAIRIHE